MNKTILITGTSSGLGRAVAKLFQRHGWNVIATMRNPANETELTTLDRVLVTRLDVEDASSIGQAMDAGIARFGHIDVLVNNAGFGTFGPLEATPIETIRRQFEVNLMGVLQSMQAILPHFRTQRAGVILNVTSTSGRMTLPFGSLYHGSKFAVEGVTEALQYELAPLGIRVKLVEPGAIKTDFAGRSMAFNNELGLTEYQPLLESAMAAYGKLMGTSSEPERIAEVVYAAATDETDTLRYIAGEDALQMLAARAAASDEEYFAQVRTQFGLAT
ncbi:SDR family oxidoreductase [Hymenobacter sp. YC55]|uniref:SDR family oxidoreductase n=1 Tax=Hymenobacter sp. YC55 TaxID=3034019 RepID=UPI0023F74CA8|nr:SDR family oxidoreductase [Hymenobacter sp. YC55]MDF7813884.1 SDR family oxidoreductase [Hymenobacter sp. YC55]